MAAAKGFSSFETTPEFQASYRALDPQRRKQADKASSLLYSNPAHPSLKTHTVKPGKHFWEAYMNAGDRIIYVPQGTHLLLVDIVKHDDIGKYGRAPRR